MIWNCECAGLDEVVSNGGTDDKAHLVARVAFVVTENEIGTGKSVVSQQFVPFLLCHARTVRSTISGQKFEYNPTFTPKNGKSCIF